MLAEIRFVQDAEHFRRARWKEGNPQIDVALPTFMRIRPSWATGPAMSRLLMILSCEVKAT